MAKTNSRGNNKQFKGLKNPKRTSPKHHRSSQTWNNIQVIIGRLLLYGVPVLILLCFVAVLNSPRLGKQPKGRDDDVLLHLQLARESVAAEDWKRALVHIEEAEKAWNLVVPRIQIGVQRGDIIELTLSLARLKTSAQCMDKPGCLRELAQLSVYWDEIGK